MLQRDRAKKYEIWYTVITKSEENAMKNRILVVEDDAAIRDAVLLNLQFSDYETAAFDDGKKAADALENDHAFDLALLDIMLPGMDGFELFGIMERFSVFAAVGFNAICGIYLFRGFADKTDRYQIS